MNNHTKDLKFYVSDQRLHVSFIDFFQGIEKGIVFVNGEMAKIWLISQLLIWISCLTHTNSGKILQLLSQATLSRRF